MSETIRLHGYRECMKALTKVDDDTKKVVREALREAAWPVQADTRARIAKYTGVGPVGISVRQRGVSVEQRKGKVTGQRPDFGALQMRKGFIPALEQNVEETVLGVELAIDLLIARAGF